MNPQVDWSELSVELWLEVAYETKVLGAEDIHSLCQTCRWMNNMLVGDTIGVALAKSLREWERNVEEGEWRSVRFAVERGDADAVGVSHALLESLKSRMRCPELLKEAVEGGLLQALESSLSSLSCPRPSGHGGEEGEEVEDVFVRMARSVRETMADVLGDEYEAENEEDAAVAASWAVRMGRAFLKSGWRRRAEREGGEVVFSAVGGVAGMVGDVRVLMECAERVGWGAMRVLDEVPLVAWLAMAEQIESLKFILQSAPPEERNKLFAPPYRDACLRITVYAGRFRLIQLFLEAEMDVSVSNDDEGTLLMLACEENNLPAARVLVESMDQETLFASLSATNADSETPFFLACLHGSAPIVRFLLETVGPEKAGTLFDVENIDGLTPLTVSFGSAHTHVVDVLVEYGLVSEETRLEMESERDCSVM